MINILNEKIQRAWRMKRTNIFRLRPTKEQEAKLFELADNCARMWNEINYKRRQSFFSGNFDWDTGEFYHKYKKVLGSATAQQIIIKNNEAWKSFFALLKKWKEGKIEDRPKPPRYWKDRKTGKRKLIIVIRNDCYKLGGGVLKFNGLRIRWSGKNRWKGKQGRLEIHYDELSDRWYAYQPVEVEPLHQPIGKRAYVDLGVRVLIMAYIEGEEQTFGYTADQLLSDWWYLTNRIAEYQSRLKKINDKHVSRQLRRLFRKRQRRFRHAVNTIVSRFIQECYHRGVSEIVMGDLKGVRENSNKGSKVNSMIHNFWSHEYLMKRIREKAEEYGIKVRVVDESYTSSQCPRCGSRKVIKRKRLFKCINCKLEAHRDAVGSVNIGLAQAHFGPAEAINRAVARPQLLRMEERAEVKADVALMSVKPLEAEPLML